MDRAAEQIEGLQPKLSQQQLDLLIRRLDHLPTLPAVAGRVLTATAQLGQGDTEAELAGIIRLIRADVALTARMLRLANSAGGQAAQTVAQAVEALGTDGLRSAVLSARLDPAAARNVDDSGLELAGFGRHCLAVAAAAEMIAKELQSEIDPDIAFTCGLLHDLGKLALSQITPKSYRRVVEAVKRHNGNIADYERKVIGVDHTVVSRRLAGHWRLGGTIEQVLWMHHQPVAVIPESLEARQMITVVSLADTIARQQRLGFSGNFVFPLTAAQLAGQLGLGGEALDRIVDALAGRTEQYAGYLGLEAADGESLYHQALSDANSELGRLNDQLRRQRGQLESQARAFKHFSGFAAGLSGNSTIPDVLLGIVKVTAAAACPAGPRENVGEVVAYSIGAREGEVLAVRLIGDQQPTWRTFTADQGLELVRNGRSSGLLPEAIEALLNDPDRLGQWVDPTGYRHQPMICGARWVGGVLYRAEKLDHPPADDGDLVEALCKAMAMALAIVQGQSKAVALSEQLAGASQVLAEMQGALADAQTRAVVGEMAAGAAHEMNTPLAVISGRAQLMRGKAVSEKDKQTWQLIVDQAERITSTITDLMEFASPAPPKPQALAMRELFAAAIDAFRSSDHPQAASARVDIHTEALPPVWADRGQIQAAIEELIANAATAAQRDVVIILRAETDQTSGAVVLSVSDNGPGMDQETLAQAFTPFFSQQPAGRRRGLGLPRVKRHLENNGGRIWIDSHPSEGTIVYIELPPAH